MDRPVTLKRLARSSVLPAVALLLMSACEVPPDTDTLAAIHSGQAAIPGQTKIEVMSDTCKTNEIRAKKQFQGRVITTTGTLSKVNELDSENSEIWLELDSGTDSLKTIRCTLPRTERNLRFATTLHEGDVLVVRGMFDTCLGFVGPNLAECRVLKKIPNPAFSPRD
jgi:hypothetical protein